MGMSSRFSFGVGKLCSRFGSLIEAILVSTYNIPFFNIIQIKENCSLLSQSCSYLIFSQGLLSVFGTVVLSGPSVFGPLGFYCFYNFYALCSVLGSKR